MHFCGLILALVNLSKIYILHIGLFEFKEKFKNIPLFWWCLRDTVFPFCIKIVDSDTFSKMSLWRDRVPEEVRAWVMASDWVVDQDFCFCHFQKSRSLYFLFVIWTRFNTLFNYCKLFLSCLELIERNLRVGLWICWVHFCEFEGGRMIPDSNLRNL